VALNLVSLGAAYGALAFIWQDGHGSHAIWGSPATGAVPTWLPLMIFAFLFGLSMDYEVFLLARMREAYDAGEDTDAAVVTGLSRTGRLVSCAALILVLAFVAMSTAPATQVRMLATGMGVGILVDATVVRCLLVPTLVSLFGRWNWWLPTTVARLLRVPPSPVRVEEHPAVPVLTPAGRAG
jgi:RND superfamily putative drug exporter